MMGGRQEYNMSILNTILSEIASVLGHVEENSIEKFTDYLMTGKRIFVTGEGRSGFMGKSFAMRLMHLGAQVFVVGETITPAMAGGDILVAVSGSGATASVLNAAKKATSLGCAVLSVTTNAEVELARASTYFMVIPAATKQRNSGEAETVQPLGSLFDQSLHIVLDAICLRYAKLQHLSNQTAFQKHSNLE